MKKYKKFLCMALAILMLFPIAVITANADGGSAGVSSAQSYTMRDPYEDSFSGYRKTFTYSEKNQGTSTGYSFLGKSSANERYIYTEINNTVTVNRLTVKSVPVYYTTGATIDDTRTNNAYNTKKLVAHNWFPVNQKLTVFFTVETQHTYSEYRTFGIYGV
ncbi:MAG: hypothetical protein KH284_03365 [Clostridiales bacterium]|nr:hypothetical protein [Clostridiales bacterium]